MSMEESISLEETNKIRISLGLKPITDDNAPADSADALAEQNYTRQRERERREQESRRIFESIAKVKNRRELNAGLKGRTLADLDDEEKDVDDARKWIKRSKKQEKILAKKRQEELENMDRAFQEEYTEKDLTGLKVAHDLDELDEGQERILTLKDSRILDGEEDELMNVEMADHERTKKRQDMKIKKPAYTGYDDDEFADSNVGMKRAVLAKYDEELEGAKETGFRLGAGLTSMKKAPQTKQETAAAVNKSLLSIDYAKNIEASDYVREGDKGFKKPKTKKKRATRVIEADPDLLPPPDAMEVDEKKPLASRRQRNLDDNFVDDDDLQSALARARQVKLAKAKAKKMAPEEIAAQIAEERALNGVKVEEDEPDLGADGEEGGGLVFDETSEFVRAVEYNPEAKRKVKVEPKPVVLPQSRQESPERMQVDQPLAELEAGDVQIKEEDDDEDEAMMLDQIENAIRIVEEEEKSGTAGAADEVGTAGEATIGAGLAGALSVLRRQGILATPSADQVEREKVQVQRDSWLAEQRRRLARREEERSRSRGGAGGAGQKDQAQREHENRMREQQEAREAAEHFKNYKPDVNIVYYDEFGRALSMKEAWKALSHRFHGKMPGRMKQEKRLKKIAEEKKREAMASGDTPLNMNRAFQARQEKAGQAHMVLSVGNRGAVPQAEGFIEPNLTKKADGKGAKGKGKAGAAAHAPATPDITGFTAAQPLPIAAASGSAGASPVPRAGFKRIGTFSAATPDSPAPSSPAVGDGAKVALSLKRKAMDEGTGTPLAKRR
ncbi:SART-1 protein [Auricularia subglabra TFB-10046 SS5]|nr:SART-1 protein [Auricularia subglabra TFB-10046 SS5]